MEADVRFMRMALEVARTGHAPYGAVLVVDGAVVATAANTSREGSTLHAELNLIQAVERDEGRGALRGATVYSSGEPCPMCAGALVWAGVDRVVYSVSVEELADLGQRQIRVGAAEIFAQAPRPVVVEGGVLREEGQALFQA